MRIRILLSFAAFGGLAFAGWRPPTAEEQSFHQGTLQTIAAAVPGCPAGWSEASRTKPRPLERVPTDTEKAPFRVDFAMSCIDIPRKNAGQARVLAALTEQLRSHENDPEAAALNRERRRIAEALGAAAGRGDAAGIERLGKEMDAVDAKLKVILNRRSKEAAALRAANQAQDTEVNVMVEVNTFYDGFDLMSSVEPVAGHPVYRAGGTHNVFLGKGLRMTTANGMSVLKRAPTAAKPPYPSALLIRVSVEADPQRARQFLASIDWKALDALIR